ncbi:chiasma assembly [Teratosphaeria destructans]|uniref:Chiasma assembly n=1 Tax=Teratosphaeria destructans TaxID=418781 RepID=A0A9W7W6Z3_9PEZI|nr:chiasma assembly [Teratosphaeria destructans]
MDFALRCNSLKCREQLHDRAVVTTCSHIFCVPCSESLGLTSPNGSARLCPACQTQLINPDDAVITQLNPTEDYKTSVLSGFSPNIIMECASRGLSFYSYQTTQEIVYQEYLAKSLTDKYSSLSSQMDKVVHDANAEILSLRDKMSGKLHRIFPLDHQGQRQAAMHLEQKELEQKNHDLGEAYRDKSKQQQQLQRLYTSMKQQQLAAGIELAAEHNAEHVLQSAGVGKQAKGNAHDRHRLNRAGSNGSGGSGGQSRTIHQWESRQQQAQGSRAGFGTGRSAPVPSTPSVHRAPLPLHVNNGTVIGTRRLHSNATEYQHPQGTFRGPVLSQIDPNVYGNSTATGYGMSAGVKVGRQQGGPIGRNGLGASSHGEYGGLGIH